VAGDFNNAGGAQSLMFFEMSVAGFANTLAQSVSANVRRRPIDWVFMRGLEREAEVVRTPEASDHDGIVETVETVQPRF
jgi:endonuclease/exonuclease/phosphatase (EEP) superfamily protein YafD